jgi:cardiolipin synthase
MALFVFYLSYALIGWGIRATMLVVILRRQLAPGASVAWIGIVFLHPYIGLVLYMLVGESRLGPHRIQQRREITSRFRDPARHGGRLPHQTRPNAEPSYQPMVLQAEKISGLPVLAGNNVEFIPEAADFLKRLLADIAAAQQHVHLLYYIFACDQTANSVADALIAAARRGVRCRLLADAMASRACFHSTGLAPKLIAAGVEVIPALPVAPIRRHLARMDLRNHRKLAVIDGRIAYAGSHNVINPDYGGRRGNPWIDLSARFTGPIVGELASIFAEDWAFETNTEIEIPYPDAAAAESSDGRTGDVLAQVVPTGPAEPNETYRRLLLAAIQSSRRELILTTPYFVPDETTLLSLMMAADRGVNVKLIMPQTADHFFAAAAGRAHYLTLLRGGVHIYLYRPALLHAKTTTVDDAFALFGSANLDVRSFTLNFELSVLLYGKAITDRLRSIQNQYLSQAIQLNLDQWQHRPMGSELTDRAVSLLSPLL